MATDKTRPTVQSVDMLLTQVQPIRRREHTTVVQPDSIDHLATKYALS
ncbi:MAG: hypothetical protein ACI8PZ_001862 [Myxococcota bacterium]|jgi:hypothetical protein